MISILTPTRDRPAGVSMLAKWIERQTYQDFEWIVVDDSEEPFKPDTSFERFQYVRRDPSKYDPEITNAINLFFGLSSCKGNFVLYFEDDDWMGPNYVQQFADAIAGYDTAVVSGLRHYHVGRRKYQDKRASPKATLKARKSMGSFMVRRDTKAWDLYNAAIHDCMGREDPLIDVDFWKRAYKAGVTINAFPCDEILLLKGIPGRSITWKHQDFPGTPDPDYKQLESWVGKEDKEIIVAASEGWKSWIDFWEGTNHGKKK